MDKLLETALYYKNNLIKRKFKFDLARKNKNITIFVAFKAVNFKHLLGLHKLTDLPKFSGSSVSIYQSILNNRLIFDDVIKSKYYQQIEERINNVVNIKRLLFSKELFFKSLKGEFSLHIKADYLVAQKFSNQYMYLFLKQEENYVAPVSFFCDDSDKYFRQNAASWKILEVEEIIE